MIFHHNSSLTKTSAANNHAKHDLNSNFAGWHPKAEFALDEAIL